MFLFLRMLEKNFNGEIFNLAIQNIKIIDLAYQIKNYFKNLDIDIIQTRDDQDKRNYNVDIKNVKKFQNLNLDLLLKRVSKKYLTIL